MGIRFCVIKTNTLERFLLLFLVAHKEISTLALKENGDATLTEFNLELI